MTIFSSPHPARASAAIGGMLALALAWPAAAQTAPERGVFVTQIGDGSRADVTQQNADSFARIVQDGAQNEADLDQTGGAAHRAQIVQDGDGNTVAVAQDGDGSNELALAQEGDGNSVVLLQREQSATDQTSAAILQRGNGNTIILAQDGSDNAAELDQLGNDNAMTVTQLNSGNRLVWSQSGDGLSGAAVTQTGNGNLQITQSNTGAAFAPPPPPPGG
jgi:Curlin associated repeat